MFKLPSPPRPEPTGRKLEGLFGSYPEGTLALMSVGAGLIAVATLAMEILTRQIHAEVLELSFAFVSVPMGVATMILAGLVARMNWRFALPALSFGILYWVTYLTWLIVY